MSNTYRQLNQLEKCTISLINSGHSQLDYCTLQLGNDFQVVIQNMPFVEVVTSLLEHEQIRQDSSPCCVHRQISTTERLLPGVISCLG